MVPKRKALDTVLSLLKTFFFNENKEVVGGGSAY